MSAQENGSAEFTVAISGPGLPPGSRDKAFERFYTGDARRGLGLAIARERGAACMAGSSQDRRDSTAFVLELPTNGSES